MINRSIITFIFLTNFMFADGYKTITRAKYNQLVQEPKVALVIGNKNYEQDSLTYPIVDATKIKDFLEERGFKVIYAPDVQTKGKLRALINQFIGSIKTDGMGLFYFSGHGMSAYNKNYLIPTKNSSIADDADIEDIGLSVNYLLRKLEKKGNRLNIVMLDACRNTLGKGSSSALGGDSAEGVFIAYATAEGKRAKDNGLFASSFVENAKIRGLTVEEVFKRVRKSIKEATGQTPFTNSGIVGDFYFSLPLIEEPTIAPVVEEIVDIDESKNNIEEISLPMKNIAFKSTFEQSKGKEITIVNDLIYQNQPFSKEDEQNFNLQQDGERVLNANNARQYCKKLYLEGYTNWRLPTLEELLKLGNTEFFQYADKEKYNVWFSKNKDRQLTNSKGNSYFIKKNFVKNMPNIENMPYVAFWTFTKNKTHAFESVNFQKGYYGWGNILRKGYVLCVHKQ